MGMRRTAGDPGVQREPDGWDIAPHAGGVAYGLPAFVPRPRTSGPSLDGSGGPPGATQEARHSDELGEEQCRTSTSSGRMV